jgi:hypothetical protein
MVGATRASPWSGTGRASQGEGEASLALQA